MEDTIQVLAPDVVARHRPRRAISLIAALALVLGGLVLARSASESPVRPADVVSEVNGTTQIDGVGVTLGKALGFGAAIQPQIDIGALIRAIVCPALNALATGPFAALIGGLVASLRVAFGCTS